MNKFIGKNCPFCKTDFIEGDDIVVCSNCDMPHHKDCWIENQGCTTFGCLGTIKSADSTSSVTTTEITFDDATPEPTFAVVYCTKCGTQNNSTFSFCSKCGNPLVHVNTQTAPAYTVATPTYAAGAPTFSQPQPQTTVTPYVQPITQNSNAYNTYQQPNTTPVQTMYQPYQNSELDSDLVQLIGPKFEYYVPKFQEIRSQNKQTSWNWAAFLFAPYWLIYRKMYGYGFAVLIGAFLLALMNNTLASILSLVGYVVIGIFANNIYMKSLEPKANQAKMLNEPLKSQFIVTNGGTNSTATIITIICYSLLAVFLST